MLRTVEGAGLRNFGAARLKFVLKTLFAANVCSGGFMVDIANLDFALASYLCVLCFT